jgi:hypothetical protein
MKDRFGAIPLRIFCKKHQNITWYQIVTREVSSFRNFHIFLQSLRHLEVDKRSNSMLEEEQMMARMRSEVERDNTE